MDNTSWSVRHASREFLDDVPGFESNSHPLLGIIIITTQLLSLGLRKLRQPRVIAEVIGGILLGTSSAPSCSWSRLIHYISRPDCLWPYTRLFRTHFPFPVYTLSLSRSEHRSMSLPLPCWA